MKKTCIICSIFLYIVLVGFTHWNYYRKSKGELYPQTTIVVKVYNDVVTLQDFNGNLWEFTGAEDWQVGDICSCIMNNNGTENIFDDEIIKVEYDGYFPIWGK